jgi:hypothetical protein
LCNIKSDWVYYKVYHKQKSLNNQVADDRVDMHLLKDQYSEFIQCLSNPKEKDFETFYLAGIKLRIKKDKFCYYSC